MVSSLLCVALWGQPAPDPQRIELKLPSGTVIESKLTMTFTDKEADLVLTTKDELKSTVEFQDGLFAFNHQITPTYLKMGDYERPMGDSKPAEVKETRTKSGSMKRYEGTVVDPVANTMIARFWTVPLPSVKPIIGNEWSFMDHREFLPYSFKGLVTKEVGDRLEVEVQFAGGAGDPMTAKGLAILDRKLGIPMRIQLQVEKGLVPGGEGERVHIDYLFETVNVKLP